jgi:FkbM family methyltransferase
MALTEQQRIALAAACTDADVIPKVDDAGVVFEENGTRFQRMHNGLRVVADGYYGRFITDIVAHLKGHHEPQEEKVFWSVLEHMPDAPTMMELGGYWSYYTMWMLKKHPSARTIVVEPIGHRMDVGRANLAANGLSASLVQAAISDVDGPKQQFKTGTEISSVPTRSVDSLMTEHGIDTLNMLHIDIQGFERRALLGAGRSFARHAIDWVFVSTHRFLEEATTMDLHEECLGILRSHGYRIVAAHTPEESFSIDGLIVAKAPGAAGPDHVEIMHCLPENIAAAQSGI